MRSKDGRWIALALLSIAGGACSSSTSPAGVGGDSGSSSGGDGAASSDSGRGDLDSGSHPEAGEDSSVQGDTGTTSDTGTAGDTGTARDTGPTVDSSGGNDSGPVDDAPSGEDADDGGPVLGGTFVIDGTTVTCQTAQTGAGSGGETIFTLGDCSGNATVGYVTVAAPSLPGTYACGDGTGFVVADPANQGDDSATCSIAIDNPLSGAPIRGTITGGTLVSGGAHTSLSGSFVAPFGP